MNPLAPSGRRRCMQTGLRSRYWVAAILAGSVLMSQAMAQAAPPDSGALPAAPRTLPARFAGRAGLYYKLYWGIDHLVVKEGESGQILRFSWRVLDPQRAAILHDKKVDPSLIAPQRGVSLVIPTLDQIGQMRQTMAPEAGRTYWMAFSNKGHLIQRGDRVDVVVGTFRAEGLVVD